MTSKGTWRPVKVLGGRCFCVWGPRSPPSPCYTCTYSHREGGYGRWTNEPTWL